MRVLYLIHGHDQLSVGGAENAAFSLFREAQRHAAIEAWILAAVHTSEGMLSHGELRTMDHSDREYLIGTSCEWFQLRNSHIYSMRRSLKRLLDYIEPDIIHLQHFAHFGIDIIPLLQRLCPRARIILTLHEYLPLCMNNGQMVTTGALKLCEKATPLACSMCFPMHSKPDLFLRHHFIKTILESCNALISPSQFLIDRYRDCGIEHPYFHMIENGLPGILHSQQGSADESNAPRLHRFAYFGQLNIFKGVLVLLKAVQLLQENADSDFIVNIYGANFDGQPEDFQQDFRDLYDHVRDRVYLRGSYRQAELPDLMQDNDWVIVPSIWWENSPVVIQEAFCHGRPVIGSNIGGTAEKIDGLGGLIFSVGSERSLANVMNNALGNLPLYQALKMQIKAPQTASKCLDAHINVYDSLDALPV
jgi:glycosyltransferase involved in cell wall biosynthesis